MTTNRFRIASRQTDPTRTPPDLATRRVPAIQPQQGKMLLLDGDDPGYSTEHAMLLMDGEVRLLSYAVEMHLIQALIREDSQHDEATAREALAQLVVAHNLRAAKQRTDSASAVAWLEERLIGLAEQWDPSELAKALNERDKVRRQARAVKRRELLS